MAKVNTNGITSPYVKTQTSFSGADILLVAANILIGNASGISYSITREKAPIFVLGSPSPQSFSRNKRGIAGSLSLTIFDRSGFHDILSKSLYAAKRWDVTGGGQSYGYNDTTGVWSGLQTGEELPAPGTFGAPTNAELIANPSITNTTLSGGTGLELRAPAYADQLPPFDITVTGRNEVGTVASMVIYGVEIVTEGSTHGLNDVGFEANYTWIARDIVLWTPAQENAVGTDEVATQFATLRGIDLGVGR